MTLNNQKNFQPKLKKLKQLNGMEMQIAMLIVILLLMEE